MLQPGRRAQERYLRETLAARGLKGRAAIDGMLKRFRDVVASPGAGTNYERMSFASLDRLVTVLMNNPGLDPAGVIDLIERR